MPPFTQRQFRDALGHFATGITIVTAARPNGTPVGMTASSFNSVSMEPPLVLWSVTRKALSAETFRTAPRFAIHVLGEAQVELANLFARSGADKFGATEHRFDAHGVPILPDCVCRFDCRRFAVHPGGDHHIVVGEVLHVASGDEGAAGPGRVGRPLVYGAGAFATALPLGLPDPD